MKTFQSSDVPDLDRAQNSFSEFCKIIAALRDPVKGCSWDNEQTHKTLARFMIEEAYEASSVMVEDAPNFDELCDELGDVLLQVVLNAQLAMQEGAFSICEVVEAITQKMIRRHPHIFGTEEDREKNSLAEIKTNWTKIKSREKALSNSEGTVYQRESVHKVYPSTTQAYKIGKLSKLINFDFKDPGEVFEKLEEEVQECKDAIKSKSSEKIQDEIADIYFTLAQLCRHLGYDPENLSMKGNQKFLNRFNIASMLAEEKGKVLESLSFEEKERLWNEAKRHHQ